MRTQCIKPRCYEVYYGKSSQWRRLMHNLISFNQLAGSYEDEHDTRLTEYYECLIDCEDDQHICKRICKEVLV